MQTRPVAWSTSMYPGVVPLGLTTFWSGKVAPWSVERAANSPVAGIGCRYTIQTVLGPVDSFHIRSSAVPTTVAGAFWKVTPRSKEYAVEMFAAARLVIVTTGIESASVGNPTEM